jgi:hypothetical protein
MGVHGSIGFGDRFVVIFGETVPLRLGWHREEDESVSVWAGWSSSLRKWGVGRSESGHSRPGGVFGGRLGCGVVERAGRNSGTGQDAGRGEAGWRGCGKRKRRQAGWATGQEKEKYQWASVGEK